MAEGRTTGEIARALGARLEGPADILIDRVETLESAARGALTFVRSARYAGGWASSEASAALVSEGVDVPGHDSTSRALLVVADADLALIRTLEMFAPEAPAPEPGVHAGAVVAPDVRLTGGASVGPGCSVGPGSEIGEGAVLGPNVVLGRDVRVGAGTVIHAGCVVMDRCSIGQRCVLHPGVVIGADGFGYRPSPEGTGAVKIPHVGDVRIGSDVEIGANTCIDRAKVGSTTVGDGTKIDNLVQIGHNCVIGRHCLVCGHVGMAGSVTIEDRVTIAGGVGIADNITIGEGATVAARSGVISDVPAGETWGGIPAANMRVNAGNYAAFRSLAQHVREIKKLAKRVQRLEDAES